MEHKHDPIFAAFGLRLPLRLHSLNPPAIARLGTTLGAATGGLADEIP